MRLLIHILCTACMAVLAIALYVNGREEAAENAHAEATRAAVHRIDQIIKLKSTAGTADVTLNERGYPTTVDVGWFKGLVPRNALMNDAHPWLEVAGESQASLRHPPVRLDVSDSLAQFWYNPYQGIVRARVPVMISDLKSTALYNRVNATALAGILDDEFRRDDVFVPAEPRQRATVLAPTY